MTAARFNWAWWTVAVLTVVIVSGSIWYAASRGWLAEADHARMTEGAKEAGPSDMAGMDMPGMEMGNTPKAKSEEPSDVPGYAPIMIAPDIQQSIGVTVGTVQQEPLRMSVNTVGIVHPNETKTARIHLRANGWVEKLFVNFTGQEVQKGEPLLSIYSPDFHRGRRPRRIRS